LSSVREKKVTMERGTRKCGKEAAMQRQVGDANVMCELDWEEK